ncbi:hypothetical protein [Rhodohalobacter sp.]
MKFEDITDQVRMAQEEYYSTGAVFADVNGNGCLDLLVTVVYGETPILVK